MKYKYIFLILILILLFCIFYSNEPFKESYTIKNKCAFIIPLHPKHYDFGYAIVSQLTNADVDLYFIFTNLEEKNLFETNLQTSSNFNYLILDSFIDLSIPQKTNSFVGIKKFFGLYSLYDKYDYISWPDSEIKFIKTDNFYEMMKNIVDNKTIVGGKTTDSKSLNIIHDSLTQLTDVSYHEKLKELSHDFSVYTWWSNVPVVDCKHAKHFLEWINFDSTTLENRISWNVFDDITYNFFCILFYNYKLEVLPEHGFSLEGANSQVIKHVNENICKLYWITQSTYNEDPSYYDNKNFYMLYHLDR
jgi:hypothetical protein